MGILFLKLTTLPSHHTQRYTGQARDGILAQRAGLSSGSTEGMWSQIPLGKLCDAGQNMCLNDIPPEGQL